jgi:hypothetical protein
LCFCIGLVSDHNPPIYTPEYLDCRHAPPCPACLFIWCFTNFFPRLALNLDPSVLWLLRSWNYRCEYHTRFLQSSMWC